jgi:hypothetical protein
MAFSQLRVSFSGSFQCRLATDPDRSNATRSNPTSAQHGWTFDYGEAPFDRVIRFHSPVELRSALIDRFVPVTVTGIEVRPQNLFGPFELPFQPVPADPLLGTTVSLGDAAFFDSAAGGGAGREAILGCKLAFGSLMTATPKSPPLLLGINRNPATTAEYFVKKPVAIAAAMATGSIVPPRQAVLAAPGVTPLSPPRNIENYANFYGASEQIVPVAATIDFSPAGATGVIASLMLGWSFTLNLGFSHFDGDTLTGRVAGSLEGVHSNL